jgi:hypothetical protein
MTKIIDLCPAGECDSDRLSEIVVAYFRAGELGRPQVAEEPAKFLEYARACREMVARMPDAQDKQKLLELAEAWEELARQAREPA